MTVTDAQIHVWEVDRPDRPWPQPPRNEPQRENGYTAAEALADMDAAGVDRAVIVPPTWVGEGNESALEAAERYPDRFAIMGRFNSDDPDAEDRLAFWAGCERHQIPLMMLMQGSPEKVAPIAERHPDLTIVLDHMALNLRVDPADSWESMPRLVALARFPKVHVKVSSAPNFSAEPYPHRDIHPHLQRLHEAFGPQRLFWGSDVTRLVGTYADCRRLFEEDLTFFSPEDREWVMGKALATALNWPDDGKAV
jgi:predicted TIM-barrel fold metal-dependent hydrolase